MESELIILISEIQSAPKFNKCVSNTHIDKRVGAVKTMCNNMPPFHGQHLRLWLCASV